MIDRDDIQDIYRDNLISHTQGIFVVKMTKASFIYRFIADIDLEIKPGESKKLKWGKMEVLVKKSSKDNSLKWYVDGKVVDEETIKLMIGYFNNSPQELRFIRTKETKNKWFLDDYFYYEMIDLYRNINYPDMFDKIEEYVKGNKGDVTAEVEVFVPDRKGNYMPHKFSFAYEAASDETKLYHYPGGKEFDFCDLIGVYILCTEYNKNYRF